ncbi:MAG: Acetolactate synthase, small subunit [Thermodesulfobacterium sp. 37_54]|jgi:acetolactate synthase-1/3 small subunit|nr:MAG: Acetolactate synthase, small subunit [Thermodesulfobacterium sp. 37_54]KUK19181.1 MAG: Acetolactate synthase, small subunit [Thermodesulfobacterium commune]MBZ4681472.1 acetolactate synthase [Thermodesulfobacterium sp.]KUK38081.1 MAG: Acetolactate synthase, small subunit [Thermodesulfobacterium commune]MDK2861615.1 acetolactate synthase small subunit [Thermodesulfobacterium sp.]
MEKGEFMETKRYTLSVLVENTPGALARIAGLFSGRGFNIDSLCVAETLDPTLSHLTLVTHGDEQILEQILKQLRRLIDVYKVVNVTEEGDHVEREMALIKVKAEKENRDEIFRICEIFRCKIVDVSPKTYVIEVTGDRDKLEAVIELLKPMGIKEIVRTGVIAIRREKKSG